MKCFTYGQYIKCIHTLRLNAILQLAEEGENYKLQKVNKKYFYNELIRNVLLDKEEAVQFINQFVEPRKKVKGEELIRYSSNSNTKKYKSKEADLVYKLKNQDIFFLIEYQSKIDNSMSYRMLNYCLDIMQEWSRNNRMKKVYGYPVIVPIVIYTGNQKWRKLKNIEERQIGSYVLERHKIELEYNLIDINKFPNQILLEKHSIFANIMMLQKAKNKKELMENLHTIMELTKNQEKLKELANIIHYLLDDVLKEKIPEELWDRKEGKVGKNDMSTLFDRLLEEGKMDIQRGREASKRRIARNMLNKKIDDKMILEITEIEKEELEKIKNTIIKAS